MLLHVAAQQFHLVQHLTSVVQKGLARCGQRHALLVAIEELRPDAVFQVPDAGTCRRERQMRGFGARVMLPVVTMLRKRSGDRRSRNAFVPVSGRLPPLNADVVQGASIDEGPACPRLVRLCGA